MYSQITSYPKHTLVPDCCVVVTGYGPSNATLMLFQQLDYNSVLLVHFNTKSLSLLSISLDLAYAKAQSVSHM